MKQSQSNRRNRGRGQSRRSGGQGGRGGTGNRTEPKVRGNAKQMLEKYRNLAQEASQTGDRVQAEHYFQHSDHYQRLLNEKAGPHGGGAARVSNENTGNSGNGGRQAEQQVEQQADPHPAQAGDNGEVKKKRRQKRPGKPAHTARAEKAAAAQPAADEPAESDGKAQETASEVSGDASEAGEGPVKFGEETAA